MPDTLDPIQAYLEDLFVAAGLDKLPSDIKEEYSERLGVEVNRRIGLAMMDSLDENSLGEFNALMEKDEVTPDDARVFFAERVPDYEARMQKVLEDFAKEFVDSTEQLKNNPA